MRYTSQKGFSAPMVLLTIVILVATGLMGWWVWQREGEKPDRTSGGTAQSVPSASQQKEPNVPEGWRLYKDNEAGFSFYYPPEWGDIKAAEQGKFLFSELSGVAFQANRRDKEHDPVEFGIRDDNAIDVSLKGDSAVVTFLTGIEPAEEEKSMPKNALVKKLPSSRACVTDEVYPYEFEPDPEAINVHFYFGYCGLLSDTYGAFAFNSNGQDITKPTTQQLKEDITKLLQTFEIF